MSRKAEGPGVAHPPQLVLCGVSNAWSSRALLTQPSSPHVTNHPGYSPWCCPPPPGPYADQRIAFTQKSSCWSNLKLMGFTPAFPRCHVQIWGSAGSGLYSTVISVAASSKAGEMLWKKKMATCSHTSFLWGRKGAGFQNVPPYSWTSLADL